MGPAVYIGCIIIPSLVKIVWTNLVIAKGICVPTSVLLQSLIVPLVRSRRDEKIPAVYNTVGVFNWQNSYGLILSIMRGKEMAPRRGCNPHIRRASVPCHAKARTRSRPYLRKSKYQSYPAGFVYFMHSNGEKRPPQNQLRPLSEECWQLMQ